MQKKRIAHGLVQRVVDGDAVSAGVAYAREFSGYSLPVLALAREAVGRALQHLSSEGLRIEEDLSTLAFQTKTPRKACPLSLRSVNPSSSTNEARGVTVEDRVIQ